LLFRLIAEFERRHAVPTLKRAVEPTRLRKAEEIAHHEQPPGPIAPFMISFLIAPLISDPLARCRALVDRLEMVTRVTHAWPARRSVSLM